MFAQGCPVGTRQACPESLHLLGSQRGGAGEQGKWWWWGALRGPGCRGGVLTRWGGHFAQLSILSPSNTPVMGALNHPFQMRHREGKQLAQRHTAAGTQYSEA